MNYREIMLLKQIDCCLTQKLGGNPSMFHPEMQQWHHMTAMSDASLRKETLCLEITADDETKTGRFFSTMKVRKI